MWYVSDVLQSVLYISVNCFVVRGCTVSRRYILVCNSDVQIIAALGGKVMYLWKLCLNGELGFLNCDDIYMFVVNKQFELPWFVFNSFYVDLQ